MRIFWISLIIIIILIASSIFYSNLLEQKFNKIVLKIEDIMEKIYVEDWETAMIDIKDIRKDWEGMSDFWSVFIEHKELDNIQVSILKAEAYIAMSDELLTKAELSSLKFLVENIYLGEKLKLGNIF
mgnify:CR=1 FL=1